MKQLKYFILGAISILWFIPIVEKLLEVVSLWIDTLAIKPSKKLLNYKKDITILQDFIKQPEEVGDYVVEYDEDDD